LKIATVIVTCNRIRLLERALRSVYSQTRPPDLCIVISNSNKESANEEKILCQQHGFFFAENRRTINYAGALNTAIEEIIMYLGIADDIYFASLDDDDEWLPEYLSFIEQQNDENNDLLAASLLRKSDNEHELLILPKALSVRDFLRGNPGICGSNTFVRLRLLLNAGCFDENLNATTDRDVLIRIFQQNPRYRTFEKHFVIQHADHDQHRLTTDFTRKRGSLLHFHKKWKCLMSDEDYKAFIDRSKKFFDVKHTEFTSSKSSCLKTTQNDLTFLDKGNYTFIIGFIAGEYQKCKLLIEQINNKKIPVDLVVIVDNTSSGDDFLLLQNLRHPSIQKIVVIPHDEWTRKLQHGDYGDMFKEHDTIDSIPLGRTILQHHLYCQTPFQRYKNPVYWIIDDDVTFSTTMLYGDTAHDVFSIINKHYLTMDALIGRVSRDPPVPTLSCARGQLVDFWFSHQLLKAGCKPLGDIFGLRKHSDYYYDLSDGREMTHLETPILHDDTSKCALKRILSGVAVSRPALQNSTIKTTAMLSRRGANTLVFCRELLIGFPVFNIEVRGRSARRGDCLWGILAQVFSEARIGEHGFALDHSRPVISDFINFDINKEVNKSAYDIIGYAANKAFQETLSRRNSCDSIVQCTNVNFFSLWKNRFQLHLKRRKSRFLMNFYRIIGLLYMLSDDFPETIGICKNLSTAKVMRCFEALLDEACRDDTINIFLRQVCAAATSDAALRARHSVFLNNPLKLLATNTKVTLIGYGSEGNVFTDGHWVFKVFYNILDENWKFIKSKSILFDQCMLLDKLVFHEIDGYRIIKYPYRAFSPVTLIPAPLMIDFLRFCIDNKFVFSNFHRKNFIQIADGNIKLIDYGRSFEPFNRSRFINSVKRAWLLLNTKVIDDNNFNELTNVINNDKSVPELEGWERLLWSIKPRSKTEILDVKVLEIISHFEFRHVLDYGAGKCGTATQIKKITNAEVVIFDIDQSLIEKYGIGFKTYIQDDPYWDNYFDCVLLNIVLCIVDASTVNSILRDIYRTLKFKGRLIVTICNPDFANVRKMEFQYRETVPDNIGQKIIITKRCILRNGDTVKKVEFHRPSVWYESTFCRCGYRIDSVIDTKGVNLDTLAPASDFKIFILVKSHSTH
jgi:SAM-dependent methyltransferase